MKRKRSRRSSYSTRRSNPSGKKQRRGLRRALILTLVLIIASAGLLTWRWRAWFGNFPELPYAPPQSIDRLSIVPGAHFASSRTISWRCDSLLQDSWLEYGLAEGDTVILERRWLPAEGVIATSRSGKGAYYHAELHGLQAGKTYRYRVHTGQESSERYSFAIPPSDEETHFVYLGDVQDPSGEMSQELFARLREQVPSPDFLAAAGDQIEGPCDHFWEAWYRAFAPWSGELTTILSTGNHEYLKRGFFRELDPRWVAQYNYPKNGPEGFEGRSYYIDFPLMRFIVIDSNGINGPIDIQRHRSWLRSALRSSAQPWQIVMFHHAVYTVRQGRSHPVMRYVFNPILEQEGADLILQGHDHAYSRISSHTESGEAISPVYLISSSSPKTYRNGWDERHDRLGSGLQLYQSIRVRADRLHYQSRQYNGELYDEIVLHHRPDAPARVEDLATKIPEIFAFDGFGSDKKGQRKAEEYRTEIERRRRR